MTYEEFQIYHADELFDLFMLMKDSLFDERSEPDRFLQFCYKHTTTIKPRDYNETLREYHQSCGDD